MKCPNDGAVLTMSERSGVEIDYCPECRGVWLDRGELDKILDRAAAETLRSAPPPSAPAAGVPAAEIPGATGLLIGRRSLPGLPATEEEGALALRALRLRSQSWRRRALA